MKTANEFNQIGLGSTEQQCAFLAALSNGADAARKGVQMCGSDELVIVTLSDYEKKNEIKFRVDATGTPIQIKVDYFTEDAPEVTGIYEIINTLAA
jgi:hypothetical protein